MKVVVLGNIKLVKRRLFVFWLLIPLLLVACTEGASGPVMVVSVSSNGEYAVSSHKDGSVTLWDIQNQTSKIVSKKANIYSAYFVKRSPHYIWQGIDNRVHVKEIIEDTEKEFNLSFPVYGHVLSSDLKLYFASDEGWGVYSKLETQPERLIKSAWGKSFVGFGKLLNLSLSQDDRYLLQSGYTYEFSDKITLEEHKNKEFYSELVGPAIWDTSSHKPTVKLDGNAAKTYATFSPDGKYVVSGCENVQLLTWSTTSSKLLYKADWLERNSKNQPPVPSEYIDFSHHHAILAVKFIDENKFVRVNTSEPYAILYEINNPQPLKYLELGTSPFPAVSDYSRNAIDSAPEAGILVTGQRDGNGINVYKYDRDKQELERIWVAR